MNTEASLRKDDNIISALLLNPQVKKASAICGVCETQIYKRLKKPDFKQRYEEARRNLLKENTARLQGLIGRSIEEMAAIFEDPMATPQVRLNAADAIIRTAIKMTETTEILQRIEDLEASVNIEWKEEA